MLQKIINHIANTYVYRTITLFFYSLRRCKKSSLDYPMIYDTKIMSDNLGDYIIYDYCSRMLNNLKMYDLKSVPTHIKPGKEYTNTLKQATIRIVAGTNILSSNMLHGIWRLPYKYSYLTNVCLMGCGWNNYDTKVTTYTKRLYKFLLNNDCLQSVRDRFTEQQLRKIGISNVVYTGCVTMWNLTEMHCNTIPTNKARSVIITLTDYDRNFEQDRYLVETLVNIYEQAYFWIQGDHDLEYINDLLSIEVRCHLKIIPHNLEAYDKILDNEDIDFVGTRLHAGIRALNKKRRSLIVAIDNRAIEVSRDTGLPIVLRNELQEKLINIICGEIVTKIEMPWDNIELWKEQFRRMMKEKNR